MSILLIRTLILYILVIFSIRLMGKRQVGELEPSDLVITILISELATIPMQDPGIPMVFGVIPILALVSVEILISFACIKFRRLNRFINGQSAMIIKNGKLDAHKLRQLRVGVDEIVEELRLNNIASVADIRYALIEPNGQLSYVLYPDAQPVTAKMCNFSPPNTGIPFVVIAEGKTIPVNLNRLNVSEEDLLKKVKKQNISRISDVFLMTLDDCGNVFIQKKEHKK